MRVMEAKAVISAQDRTGNTFSAVAAKMKRLERAAAMQARAAPMLERASRAAAGWGSGLAVAAGGLGALGGAMIGSRIKEAVVDYAALERQMNRIGLTGGASADETAQALTLIKKMAEDMKLPLDTAVSGLDALVASGKTMEEALAFLPSVLATAQASGAATSDIARTAMTMAGALKVPVTEMQSAFDSLVVAGNLGHFELDAMSQHLPKIAASAQKLGLVGVDGVRRLGAMLQVVRDASGTDEQAATGVTDAFEKLLSPTVLKAALKAGHNFKKIMLDAEKQGKNSFEAIIEYLRLKTKGTDLEKNLLLSSIFSEADSRRAIVGLIKYWDSYQSKLSEIEKSQGAVGEQLTRILNDSQAQVQAVQTKMNNAMLSMGQAAMPAVAEFLERADLEMQLIKQQIEQADTWMKRNLGFGFGDFQKATGFGGESNEQVKTRIARNAAEKENPALARVHALEDERKRHEASLAGDQTHVDALKGYGYTPDQIAAEVPTYGAWQAKMAEIDRALAAARLNALIGSGGWRPADTADRAEDRAFVAATGGRRPADADDRMAARNAAANVPFPFPVPGRNEPVKAVVEGPVQVTGSAQVNVTVTVQPSDLLLATYKEARGAMKIQNGAPTGRSMPEAEPPSRGYQGP